MEEAWWVVSVQCVSMSRWNEWKGRWLVMQASEVPCRSPMLQLDFHML